MTWRGWFNELFLGTVRPRQAPSQRIVRDVEEQRRIRDIWVRLERVGREIQETATQEQEQVRLK